MPWTLVQSQSFHSPGPGTAATTSSFSGLLADSVLQAMGQS